MIDWELREPLLLLAALLAPLVYWLASRTPSSVQFSSLAIVDRAPRSLRSRLSRLPAVLIAVATVSLSIALAGPRTPDAETKVSREGIGVMLVVDRSSSMNARDMVEGDAGVDRLTAVKDVLQRFVLGVDGTGGRPDDMIGVIAFARYADSLCPLTLDHGNLVSIVEDVQIVDQQNEDGTAIGDGLGLAVERLRRHAAKSKIVILLTDGVNNAGLIDPDRAAELARAHDIKVYCVGAGTNGLAPYPVQDMFGRTRLRAMQVEIDEETLQEIAETTGGRYFRATDMQSLREIYDEIDRLERTKITEVRYLQYTEHFQSFVFAAFGLIGLATVASGSFLRRLP